MEATLEKTNTKNPEIERNPEKSKQKITEELFLI